MKYKKYIFPLVVIGVATVFGVTYYLPIQKVEKVIQTQNVTLNDGGTYTLTASKVTKSIAGKEQSMLAYNGSIPGPTITVKQGSQVTILFKNETNETQLLHSHGVRMDNKYDGSQMVQKEVKPGQSFMYTLKFPDAGIYWYHPHAGEVKGQALGLYGAFVVTPSNSHYFPEVNDEHVLFLSDIPVQNNVVTINSESSALMGHYGNVMLVNGEERYLLQAQEGEVKRLYVVNAANVRPFNFAIANTKMKLVGGDSGAYEKASFIDHIILAPSERAIIDVYFPKSGTFALQNKTPETTYTLGTVEVGSQKVKTSYMSSFNQLQVNQDTIASITPFRNYRTQTPDKHLKLTIDTKGMGGMMDGNSMRGSMKMMSSQNQNDGTIEMMGMRVTKEQAVEHCKTMPQMPGCEEILHGATATTKPKQASELSGIEWEDTMPMMSQMMNKDTVAWKIVDTDTGKENMDINWDLAKDKPVVIEIDNDKDSMHPMQHPIHFHGQRFLVVSRNGVFETNLVWKDTTLVRVGEKVRIILDPSNVGDWMAHCHISEHLANGMMLGFMVK